MEESTSALGAFLVNQYGEVVVALEPDNEGYYQVPKNSPLTLLAAGDIFKVIEFNKKDYQ